MNSYDRIYNILTEVKGGPMRQRSKMHLTQVAHARDFHRQAKAFGAPPHEKPDAGEATSSEVKVSIAKAQAALKLPTLTGMQRAKIQNYYNRLTNKKTGVTATTPIKAKGAQNESEMFPSLRSLPKLQQGLSDKQKRVWNRAMSKPKKSGEWRSPTRARKIAKRIADSIIHEVAPPGWGHTKAEKEKTKPWKPKSKVGGSIQAMKRAQQRGDIPEKYNIFALAWSMKNKGDKPHYKPGVRNVKKKKYRGKK